MMVMLVVVMVMMRMMTITMYKCDDGDDDHGPRQNESAGLGRVVSQWGPDVPC